MYKDIIDRIKSCLPKNESYVIHEPFFENKAIQDIKNCIDSSYVSTQGEYLEKFKLKLQKFTNSKYILLTNTGTSALFLSLKIHNVEQTEIFVPSMTFAATVNTILYNNAIPHFIDCERDSPNIDIEKFDIYLKSNFFVKNQSCFNKLTKKRVSSILVVHAYGLPVNIGKLKKITKKYHLEIIEDAAGGLGSYYNNKHIGINSRASIISFNGNKIVTTGMGGAILLKNNKDYKKIKHIMSTARLQHKWKIEHDMLGYNLRMANINAAVGYNQLLNLNKTLIQKRKLFLKYRKAFKNNEYCYISDEQVNSSPNHWVINLMLKDKYIKHHQQLLKYMHRNKLLIRELWKPQHLAKYLKKYPRSDLTNTIQIWKRTISLPSCYYNK